MPVQSANKFELVTLEKWLGLNQQNRRASIDDQELWWNENLYPIGPGSLRSVWGPAAPIYTVPSGFVIRRIFLGFYGCGPDGPTPQFGAPPPGRLCWIFRAPANANATDPSTQLGYVDEVDLDSGHVTVIGQIWRAIPPQWWASAKVWRPQFYGRSDSPLGIGQPGGVLFGSPQGLYAWSNPTGQTSPSAQGNVGLFSPGDPAPDWLTDAAETLSPVVPMPIGLPGIYAMEVYNERLWVAGKDVISFSAPSNGADFSTIDGGGSFGYFGDKLVYSYMDLSATAGYLYVFGDSSTDIISNVQLSGSGTAVSPFVTSFNYQNLDPQIGQGFPRPVGRWGRYKTLIGGHYNSGLANQRGAGVFVLMGGEMQVIGEKITNIYDTMDTSNFYPTFAPATMFGFRIMLINMEVTDPFGRKRALLMTWNGGYWTPIYQNLELIEINSYEQDSVIAPYGTDGTYLYRLLDHPDPALPKRLSTKAYAGTGLSQITVKNFRRLYLEYHDNLGGGVSFTGKVTTTGGGIPNGVQDVAFEMVPGQKYQVEPYAIEGAGLNGAVDLESISPDFTIERLHVAAEERTIYGA